MSLPCSRAGVCAAPLSTLSRPHAPSLASALLQALSSPSAASLPLPQSLCDSLFPSLSLESFLRLSPFLFLLSPPLRVSFGPLSGGFSLPCVCVPVLTVFPLGSLPSGQCFKAQPHHLWAERGRGLPQGTCPKSKACLRLPDVQRCPVVVPQPTALSLLPA